MVLSNTTINVNQGEYFQSFTLVSLFWIAFLISFCYSFIYFISESEWDYYCDSSNGWFILFISETTAIVQYKHISIRNFVRIQWILWNKHLNVNLLIRFFKFTISNWISMFSFGFKPWWHEHLKFFFIFFIHFHWIEVNLTTGVLIRHLIRIF